MKTAGTGEKDSASAVAAALVAPLTAEAALDLLSLTELTDVAGQHRAALQAIADGAHVVVPRDKLEASLEQRSLSPEAHAASSRAGFGEKP